MKLAVKTSVAMCSLSMLLTACGGGGGGGGSSDSGPAQSNAASSSAASSASSNSAGSASSSSASSSAQSSSSSSADALRVPSLQSPDAGSTALVGNDFEGIWHDEYGLNAVISPEGKIYQRGNQLNLVANMTFGSGTWQLLPGAVSDTMNASGSGTLVAKTSLSGPVSLSYGGGSSSTGSGLNIKFTYPITLTYDRDNARAVTQETAAGTWASFGAVIDKDGNLSARSSDFGNCAYTGTVKLHTGGSHKNLFDITLNVADVDGTCNTGSKHYTGLAFILTMENGKDQLHFLTEGTSAGLGMEGYWDRQ